MSEDNPHKPHPEQQHKSNRSAWLRAAVLGADDGLVSTSSLMLGVLAASHNHSAILTAGVAGLAAGALSMAAGEFVSVSSQRDSERADIAIERASIAANPDEELAELAWIYEQRGLDAKLAKEVAKQLHARDAIGAHARDELGIDTDNLANPGNAALASALAFSIGATIPLLAALIASPRYGVWAITFSSLVALAVSGAIGAFIGGGHKVRAGVRVFAGGGAAMGITFIVGHFVGGAV